MILVLLGTQDKPFDRLLKQIDKLVDEKIINDEIIVQAGFTKYNSKNMKIFDLIPHDELLTTIEKTDLIITHGGVGSIMEGIKANKKVIATPRLKKYGEHVNDHQLQIIKNFSDLAYIIPLYDIKDLEQTLKNVKNFKNKPYVSNTDKFTKMIEDYIDKR